MRFIPAFAGNTSHDGDIFVAVAVHPRVCGEHSWLPCWMVDENGSSPRLRGTRSELVLVRVCLRFIPAFAGNTWRGWFACVRTTVHPRVCGEHARYRATAVSSDGSSPRLRGTQHTGERLHIDLRFIPAFAGNTYRRPAAGATRPVHPRVCGEHLPGSASASAAAGSSPRLRGTRPVEILGLGPQRFIPAFAGNTFARFNDPTPVPVHPRVCGEHSLSNRSDTLYSGSSPRLRGTPRRRQREHFYRRFIPAFAGNTAAASMPRSSTAVHPRVCGEHHDFRPYVVVGLGSSPRLRGTLSDSFQLIVWFRFIPAFAGNTGLLRPRRPYATVHPRVCGEHPNFFFATHSSVGSSPRLRGTRRGLSAGGGFVRFIPAFAGNTLVRPLPRAHRRVHPRVCGEHSYWMLLKLSTFPIQKNVPKNLSRLGP